MSLFEAMINLRKQGKSGPRRTSVPRCRAGHHHRRAGPFSYREDGTALRSSTSRPSSDGKAWLTAAQIQAEGIFSFK
jgi:hypothetical protein